MALDPSIFKAYDIRGIVPEQLDEAGAEAVGKAFAEFLKTDAHNEHPTVVVSGDMRTTTESLKKALITGIIQQGADVIDIGLASTPTFYFAVAQLGATGGVQVSASHNPKEYNGFKLTRARAVPISGDDGIHDIQALAVKNAFEPAASKGQVTTQSGILELEYETQVAELNLHPKTIKPFNIVIDAANAMGAIDMDIVFKDTPCRVIKMNFDLDGTFPNHQADPLDDANLQALKNTVLENNADFGIAPDGDSDRIFFVDDKGQTVRQEILRGIMAQVALKEHPGATVCYDIRPGKITQDMIEELGGKASVTRVGHSLIKAQMLKENAVFGGESSGHYFYQFKNGTYEAPIVLIVKFLEYLSAQNKPLSAIVSQYSRYFHSGEINSTVQSVPEVLQRIQERYQDADINLLDGVTVTYPDFWFNVRGSNTEPKIRLNLEAVSEELMLQKKDEVLAVIRE